MWYSIYTVKETTTRNGEEKMEEFKRDIESLMAITSGVREATSCTIANVYRFVDLLCEKYGKEKVLAALDNYEE